MTIRYNTGIVKNGLLLYYDISNTSKCFIGAPTTNSQWNNGSEFSPWSNNGGLVTDVTGTQEAGPIIGAKTWRFEKTGTGNQWHGWESTFGGIFSGSSGDVWSCSYWYKTSSSASNFSNFLLYVADWSRAYSFTQLVVQNSLIPDGKWHRNYISTQINEAYSNAIIADGPSWQYSTSAGILWINGLQWEKNPYSSAFAKGTRTATQGLIDLSGNGYSLDLTNARFGYDGNLKFDNAVANSRIQTNCAPTLGDFTIGVWFKATGNSGGYDRIIDSLYNSGIALMRNSTNANSWGGGVAEGNSPYGIFLTLQDGAWHYLVSIRKGTTHTLYGDGVANTVSNTVSNNALPATSYAIGNWTGAQGNQPFMGEIPIVQIYDRALSIDEVMQNFEAHRSRFGI